MRFVLNLFANVDTNGVASVARKGLVCRLMSLKPFIFLFSLVCIFTAAARLVDASETRTFPSFYCSWESLSRAPQGIPRGFIIFGERPQGGRASAPVRISEGRDTEVWLSIEEGYQKWRGQEGRLSGGIVGRSFVAELDVLPIIISFSKFSQDIEELYFARAYYGDPKEGLSYICRDIDIGFPGGAMSGGN